MLRQKDFKTTYVNSLADATISIGHDTPDILFLDNHLPDGLGIDYIKTVKEEYPQIRIIMITAHDGPLEKSRALMNGANAFIGKPLTRELIYSSVEQFMIPRPTL